MPKFRPGTNDQAIWENINARNEYRLPDDMAGQFVIDIGAHIGAFSHACLERGAKVVAFEPDRENFRLLTENVGHIKNYFLPFRYAVWGKGLSAGEDIPLSHYPCQNNEINTGGGSLLFGDIKEFVPVCNINDVIQNCLDLYTRQIDLIKLDCEYSEWSIIYGMSLRWLNHIKVISGEYHEIAHRDTQRFPFPEMRIGGLDMNYLSTYGCTERSLVDYLANKGYDVEHFRHGQSNLGMFFATKRGQ